MLSSPLPARQREKVEYPSLALKELFDLIGDDWKHGVLDLGPVVGTNVDYFAHASCKFYVADVFRALESRAPVSIDGEACWDPVFAELLPYEEGTRFDLILAWDVLNYLSPPQIESLFRHIGHFCDKGTFLVALVSTRRELPARPRAYHIQDSGKLLYQSSTQAVRPCPLYKEPDLCRLMPDFRVKGTYLLRNGIQEYVFTYTPPSKF